MTAADSFLTMTKANKSIAVMYGRATAVEIPGISPQEHEKSDFLK